VEIMQIIAYDLCDSERSYIAHDQEGIMQKREKGGKEKKKPPHLQKRTQ
jgi:hypothetical protein